MQVSVERTSATRDLLVLLLLTVLAFLLMGYHPGLEDDAFYLAAIKRNLNPGLFPHDADFFRLQFQATIFDKLIALSIRLTHLPVAWAVLLWQFAGLFFVLRGTWQIARRSFTQAAAQWSAVATIAVLLTLPLPGIAINLADQYLHPRTLATALILAAIAAVLDRRLWRAGILLALAFSIHAIMAAFGVSFCLILWWNQRFRPKEPILLPVGVAALIPMGWLFEPASDAWRQAAATRSFYFVAHWQWYEWIGVFAPLLLLSGFLRFWHRSQDDGDDSALPLLLTTLAYFGIFQTIAGLAIMLPPGLERLRPFEPMRYLHLLYFLFFLIAGGLLGRYALRRHAYRWILLFVPLAAGMFYAQRQMFPATEHLELPAAESRNEWLQAFAWIKSSTPADALFALDPHYMELPGEDYHGFRALAERSALADYDKDGGMAARVPRLAPRWLKEVTAERGWRNFDAADFARLRQEFGVTWVVVQQAPSSMSCPYENSHVKVCRLY